MKKVVFCGDLHIGLRCEDLDRTPEVLKALDFVIDYCITEQVSMLSIGGDIFDNSHPIAEHISEFMKRLNRLEDNNLQTYVMMGNHDAVSSKDRVWALSPCEQVGYKHIKFITEPTAILTSTDAGDFIFVPHMTKQQALSLGFSNVQDALESVCNNTLDGWKCDDITAVTHFNAQSAKAGTEAMMLRQSDLQIPQALLKSKKVKRIVNHHIHTAQSFGKVFMPGSLICTDFGDTNTEKGFLLGTFHGNGIIQFKNIPTPQFPLSEFEIDLTSYSKSVLDKAIKSCVKKLMGNDIVKIKLLINEENLSAVSDDYIKSHFTNCKYIKQISRIVYRDRKKRDVEQAPNLKPIEAVKVFLDKRKPPNSDEILTLASMVMSDELAPFKPKVLLSNSRQKISDDLDLTLLKGEQNGYL